MLKQSVVLAALATTLVSVATAQSFAQGSARSGYRVVNVKNFVANNQISNSNPNQVAVKLFADAEEAEGRKSENVDVKYPTRDTAVVVMTKEGLADDSVAAIRRRVEMRRVQNRWQVTWVGEQNKCARGGGSQVWTSKLCS
ncbi:hypothetical protein NIES4071_20800 [Calothrix sp. NIES-4071]|nr:hypothetical protein NIES4071_20800 [Calothrix sp. NIES-4071]BAZ56412.1 hypothetical protein NIES4105_20750 [Calothrix sp. NIES-4105]